MFRQPPLRPYVSKKKWSKKCCRLKQPIYKERERKKFYYLNNKKVKEKFWKNKTLMATGNVWQSRSELLLASFQTKENRYNWSEENTQRQLNYIFIIIVTLNVYKWHLNTPCELRVNCVCVCVLLCAVDKCESLTMTTTAASFSA